MPTCCVPNCNSGYISKIKKVKNDGGKPPSIFKIRPEHLTKFTRKIKRGDKALTTKDHICSLHFYANDILTHHDDIIINGEVVKKGSPRQRPVLKNDASPRIFPDCPSFMTTSERKRRATRRVFENDEDEHRNGIPDENEHRNQNENEDRNTNQDEGGNDDGDPSNKRARHSSPPREFKGVPFEDLRLPSKQWAVHQLFGFTCIVKINNRMEVSHGIKIENNTVSAEVQGKPVKGLNFDVEDRLALEKLVDEIDSLRPCEGTDCGKHHVSCKGWVINKRAIRCMYCKYLKDAERRREKQEKKRLSRARKHKQKVQVLKRSKERSKAKVQSLREKVKSLYTQFKSINKMKLEELISDLPLAQQKLVLTCHQAAHAKGIRGRRYELNWIYECILMRIKSPSLYKSLREKKVLPLPSRITLGRYIKKLHPMYGFQDTLFEVLKKKVSGWSVKQRHGTIQVDEIKLQPGCEFDKNLLKMWGFVNLGKHTPGELKAEMGDHALVLLYQPFQGNWRQTIGCFLSKGNVKGKQLSKILVEGVALCENSGLHVDAIVSDGAKWNRNMWEHFDISPERPSCTHPVDDNRKLWFLSDWCHLIKCMRNILCPLPPQPKKDPKKKKRKQPEKSPNAYLFKEITTPEGTVKRQHWIALWEEEDKLIQKRELRYCPQLEKKMIYPTGFQRMNVAMAIKFFGNSAQKGMEWYASRGKAELQDSKPTQLLIARVNKVFEAMNAGGPKGALYAGSKEEKCIEDFLTWNKECIKLAHSAGKESFWSQSTDTGLLVTLSSTLELAKYLRTLGFSYLMTRRLNQDALEHFFGCIRQMAAPNPNPDPKLFAMLYRLLSVYSLVSPPKGSNVAGVANVEALVGADDQVEKELARKREELDNVLDDILELGAPLDQLPMQHQEDHQYRTTTKEKYITHFMAGFTAFKKKKLAANCQECLETLIKPREEAGEGDAFTLTKEAYGGFSLPTDSLVSLVKSIELAASDCLVNHGLQEDMVFLTLKYIRIDAGCFVGCMQHTDELTKKILKYYLLVRMLFTAGMKNKEFIQEKEKKLMQRKKALL